MDNKLVDIKVLLERKIQELQAKNPGASRKLCEQMVLKQLRNQQSYWK